MLKKRDFYHQRIKYSFHFHHERLKYLSSKKKEFKKLEYYLYEIYKGNIPNYIFNSKEIQRISQFKIKGIKSSFLRSFTKKLVRENKIKIYDSNFILSQYVNCVFENFKKNNFSFKPGHAPILKNILIKDNSSIAIEIPIWTKINNSYLTGHIDLLQIKQNNIFIIDYKPEGNFLSSLPQVATYGLIIKKILNLNNINCISFNRKEAWEYPPEILTTDIKYYLLSIGYKKREWEKYLD
ncbi:MAG: hypothetical protein ACTSQP_14675 [Promethearchaeota archaeon]